VILTKINKVFLLSLIFIFNFIQLKSSVYKTGKVIDKRLIKKGEYLNVEEVKVKSGNKIFRADNFLWKEENYNTELKKGDRVYFKIDKYGKIICGYKRDVYSIGLIIFTFIVLVFFLGKKRILSIFSILINFFLFLFIFIPSVKKGLNPIIAVLLLSFFVSGISTILNLGFNKKGLISFLTIISAIFLNSFLAIFVVKYLNISGVFAVAGRRIVMAIHSLGWKIGGVQNFIIGSFILASLGAAVDVSVCLTSSASEILNKNPYISEKELFISLKDIWGKIFSMMTGGILFVYFGTGISFFFLIYLLKIPFIRVINWEFITILISGGIISGMSLIFVIPFLGIYLKILKR